ncbi:hypothetical protein PAXRUDRAFT_17558 [Paxillus rubicundulus Ve08.2h10]|uniref:Uncharacterized protein n=1 Tax=Paxillus rubicundulus Ve08.2h10 TaxID=930991 RepID=A0A0D0C2E4_9AGAM|nr:hypothetical protein PAXRUDRAFT_17558 [Paxillus rubicundulus Ve08.2h10]
MSRVANSSLVQSELTKILSTVFSGHSTGLGSSLHLATIPSDIGTPTQGKQLEILKGHTSWVSPFRSPPMVPNSQAHKSLFDRPAVPLPRDQHQGEFDYLDLPTTRRPFISSSRSPVDSTPAPISTCVQRFWHSLVAGHASLSHTQQKLGLQPIPGRCFWKLPTHIPLTEVAAGKAKNGVAVGRRERRRKKRHHKPQEPQAPTGSSSQPEQSGSTSDAGPSTSQTGLSNTSNAAAAGRCSSYAPSNVGSEDDWDNMDCCAKCLDYLCVGPGADREIFRPWKKKLCVVLEAKKQAKEDKERAKAEKRRAERRRRRNEHASR